MDASSIEGALSLAPDKFPVACSIRTDGGVAEAIYNDREGLERFAEYLHLSGERVHNVTVVSFNSARNCVEA